MDGKRNDGGPAFPQNDLSAYGMGPAEKNNGGMTLRDWFAGQALAGVETWAPSRDADGSPVEMHGIGLWSDDALRARAEWAYAQADAMLDARHD